jgi:hypothetical protein
MGSDILGNGHGKRGGNLMTGFGTLRKAVRESGKHMVAAKVVAAYPALLAVDVIFEGEQLVREKVPLRIFNDDGGLGEAFVPRVGSEVLIDFVDGMEIRPEVIRVQEWTHRIMRKGPPESPSFEMMVNDQDELSIKRGAEFELKIDSESALNVKKVGSYELKLTSDGKLHVIAQSDATIECVNALIKASGNIDLGVGGTGVHTQQSHPVCFVTGAPIMTSQTVKAKM